MLPQRRPAEITPYFHQLRKLSVSEAQANQSPHLRNGLSRVLEEIRGKRIQHGGDKGFVFEGITRTVVSVAAARAAKLANSGHFPAPAGKSRFRRLGGGASRTRTCNQTTQSGANR